METQREALVRLAGAKQESLAALSRMLRRNPAYLAQFVSLGSPRRLAEHDRRLLADHFGVSEAELGGPAAVPDLLIPWLDVAAAAGPGTEVAAERRLRGVPFAAALLREVGVTPGDASLIRARGESMAPGILDGDRLLVDAADRAPERIGRVYVLRRGELLSVKRVARAGTHLTIVSDNPAFASERVPLAEVVIIGRVKLLLREPG